MSYLPKPITSTLTKTSEFQDMWVVTEEVLQNISSTISGEDFISKVTTLFTDPHSVVTSATMYPFAVPAGQNRTIVVGTVPMNVSGSATDLQAPEVADTVVDDIIFEVYVPMPEDKNFLLFEPFTTYRMYIPFIGVIDLEARRVLGKTLQLQYAVDLHTGGATVYLNSMKGSQLGENIYTGSCQLGVSIPFGSTNEGQMYVARTIGAVKTGLTLGFGGIGTPGRDITKTTSAQTIKGYSGTESFTPRTSPTTGRLLKPAQSMSTRESTVVKGEVTETTHYPAQKGHSNPATLVNGILNISGDKASVVGGAPGGDFSQFTCPSTPYLIITRTNIHDIEDYGHYFGYACAEKIRLGDHHGYCEISNIHMEGMTGVTAAEIDVIEEYLKNGVILP